MAWRALQVGRGLNSSRSFPTQAPPAPRPLPPVHYRAGPGCLCACADGLHRRLHFRLVSLGGAGSPAWGAGGPLGAEGRCREGPQSKETPPYVQVGVERCRGTAWLTLFFFFLNFVLVT